MVQKEEIVHRNDFKKITIDIASADIIIRKTEDKDIRIVEETNYSLKTEEKFYIEINEETLKVTEGNWHNSFNIFGLRDTIHTIVFELPESCFNDIEIKSNIGDVKVESDFNLSTFNCIQKTGDFYCDCTLASNYVYLKSALGDVNIKNLLSVSYEIITAHGDTKINSVCGSGNVQAQSGDIKLSYKDIAEYADVKSKLGDIHLYVPRDLCFEFRGKCIVGDIKSKLNSYWMKDGHSAQFTIGKEPYKKIFAESKIGDIYLNEI